MKLTFKTPEIVARAVKAGLTVYWQNGSYQVVWCPGTNDLWMAHHETTEELHWPSYDVKDFFSYVSQDTEDFLATLLFCNEPDGRPEDGAQPTVYDFAPEFISAVEQFIAGFRETLDDTGLDVLSHSFGGNVYLSLLGAGSGFWDDCDDLGRVVRDDLGRVVHDRLVTYSGDRHRFEHLDVSNDESGLLDMSFIPSAREEYRNKTFKLL